MSGGGGREVLRRRFREAVLRFSREEWTAIGWRHFWHFMAVMVGGEQCLSRSEEEEEAQVVELGSSGQRHNQPHVLGGWWGCLKPHASSLAAVACLDEICRALWAEIMGCGGSSG